MKIFITGGTGFIGSHIVAELCSMGHEITILARNENKVPALIQLGKVTIIKGDLSDIEAFEEKLIGMDVLIHVALHWGDSAVEILLNDTLSSLILFEKAAKAGVKNFIYTSSTAVNDWVYMDETARVLGAEATVFEHSKQNPVTYYGATKGATELFMQAIAFEYKIKANIVRPGYTFGNPAVEGGDMEADTRFKEIIKAAKTNSPIKLVKYDGTQFIDAADLAKVYSSILKSGVNGKMYFGLGSKFITWEAVAYKAVKLLDSKSVVEVEDKGWPESPALFDVEAIKRDFDLSFESWEKIITHLKYIIGLKK